MKRSRWAFRPAARARLAKGDCRLCTAVVRGAAVAVAYWVPRSSLLLNVTQVLHNRQYASFNNWFGIARKVKKRLTFGLFTSVRETGAVGYFRL